MKTFIVFLAIMLINISFLSFHSDMVRYSRLQVMLKATAEECAAGGALYQDEEEFRCGRLVINQAKAQQFAAALTAATEKDLPSQMEGRMDVRLTIFDDEKGYDGCEGYALTAGLPSVHAVVLLHCKDLFRLPFLMQTKVKRSAVYEWENRYGNSLTNQP